MNYITSFFKGLFIGMGAILPGISSGVFCVIFGIYDKLINSFLGLFKNFKENIKFLLPICLGTLVGFLLFGKFLNYLFLCYETECKSLFLGFIIGGLPSLIKTANKNQAFKPRFLIYTLLSLGLGIFLFMLERNYNISNLTYENNFLFLFLSGLAMSFGIIIPGVSSTVILMCLGTYYTYLNAISNLDFYILLPIGLGLSFGSLILLFVIRFLLNKYHSQTFYSIIGFVLGSTLIIIPDNFSILNVSLFLLGLSVTYNIEKRS